MGGRGDSISPSYAPVFGWHPLWPVPQQGQHLVEQRTAAVHEDAALRGEGAGMTKDGGQA